MSFEYNVAKVEYSTDGGVTFVDLGHIKSDGTEFGVDAAGAETSAGIDLYAGTSEEPVFFVTDLSKKAALRTAMLDDNIQGTIQLRYTDHAGITETLTGYSVIVEEQRQFQTKVRNGFLARFKRTFI